MTTSDPNGADVAPRKERDERGSPVSGPRMQLPPEGLDVHVLG